MKTDIGRCYAKKKCVHNVGECHNVQILGI